MNFLLMAAVAANVLTANPAFNTSQFERALHNYRAMLAGQKQFGVLSAA